SCLVARAMQGLDCVRCTVPQDTRAQATAVVTACQSDTPQAKRNVTEAGQKLRQVLAKAGERGRVLVTVFDGFEYFVETSQRFLYQLLDSQHSVPVITVAMARSGLPVERLEKRVRSRYAFISLSTMDYDTEGAEADLMASDPGAMDALQTLRLGHVSESEKPGSWPSPPVLVCLLSLRQRLVGTDRSDKTHNTMVSQCVFSPAVAEAVEVAVREGGSAGSVLASAARYIATLAADAALDPDTLAEHINPAPSLCPPPSLLDRTVLAAVLVCCRRMGEGSTVPVTSVVLRDLRKAVSEGDIHGFPLQPQDPSFVSVGVTSVQRLGLAGLVGVKGDNVWLEVPAPVLASMIQKSCPADVCGWVRKQ
ncbi:hypothetical protein KIPB_002670, partial [Kipferlia bialata]